jgi:hypothetical protein
VLTSNTTRYCGRDHLPQNDYCDEIVPVDCQVSQWSPFSLCSRRCEVDGGNVAGGDTPNGEYTRTRQVTVPAVRNGRACPPLSETVACGVEPCPIDCVMSEWSEFSACSQPCDGGISVRTRTVLRQPSFNGLQCLSRTEVRRCCFWMADDACFNSLHLVVAV